MTHPHGNLGSNSPPPHPMLIHPLLGHSLLIMETLQPHSEGLWVSDQLDAETSVTDNTQRSQETDIHASGRIQTCDPASEQPQTHALDHVATGILIHTVIE